MRSPHDAGATKVHLTYVIDFGNGESVTYKSIFNDNILLVACVGQSSKSQLQEAKLCLTAILNIF